MTRVAAKSPLPSMGRGRGWGGRADDPAKNAGGASRVTSSDARESTPTLPSPLEGEGLGFSAGPTVG